MEEGQDETRTTEVNKDPPQQSRDNTQPSSKTIDYSQSYGPIFPVTLVDKTHQLKMFVGETPSIALTRFCGMLKLNAVQCTQVKVAYYERCQNSDIRDINLETELFGHASRGDSTDTDSNDGTVSASSPFDFQKQQDTKQATSTVSSSSSKYPPMLEWFLTICEEYWNIIALIIVVLYIATEQMP
jgi:hypothetical protein